MRKVKIDYSISYIDHLTQGHRRKKPLQKCEHCQKEMAKTREWIENSSLFKK